MPNTAEWGFTRKDLGGVSKQPIPAILLTYLEDNQSECIDVRFRRRYRGFHTKPMRRQEFWRHERRCATLKLYTGCHLFVGVDGHGHKTKVRKAGTRRDVIGHKDVRLLNVKTRNRSQSEETDSFEIPVCETGTMEVLQSLGCPVQLPSHYNGGSGRWSEVTYQFQSVGVILSNVLHDSPVLHPLRHSSELPFLHVPPNPDKLYDVGVR